MPGLHRKVENVVKKSAKATARPPRSAMSASAAGRGPKSASTSIASVPVAIASSFSYLARLKMSRRSSPASARVAALKVNASAMPTLLEIVLPRANLGEYLDRVAQAPSGVALGGRDHLRLTAAQEGIGQALLADRRGQRRLAARALRLFPRLALRERCVTRLDRLREADIGERVFVPAIDTGGSVERRELGEGFAHLLRGTLEEPPATAREERVAAEDEGCAARIDIRDVARGVRRNVEHAEGKAETRHRDAIALGEALADLWNRLARRPEDGATPARDERRHAAHAAAMMVRGEDRG